MDVESSDERELVVGSEEQAVSGLCAVCENSARNRTDLGAELNRSRHGTGPISVRGGSGNREPGVSGCPER